MQVVKISLYLFAFVLSNFVVLWYGKTGLIFTAIFLIPFDFVLRCLFHEQWKGSELILKLGALVAVSSLITYTINADTARIAIASVGGFISAQIVAGLFYQRFMKSSYFIKVNGSDVLAIVFDSLVFQLIAFCSITPILTWSQIILKILGGLFWYWIIFVKYKLHTK